MNKVTLNIAVRPISTVTGTSTSASAGRITQKFKVLYNHIK